MDMVRFGGAAVGGRKIDRWEQTPLVSTGFKSHRRSEEEQHRAAEGTGQLGITLGRSARELSYNERKCTAC